MRDQLFSGGFLIDIVIPHICINVFLPFQSGLHSHGDGYQTFTVLWRIVQSCTLSHVLPHQHTDQRAQQRPILFSAFPHHAQTGIKGKAGEPTKGSSPGVASRVTPERRTGRTARRCLSWWVIPQEGISSTHQLPYLVAGGSNSGKIMLEFLLPASLYLSRMPLTASPYCSKFLLSGARKWGQIGTGSEMY